MSLDHYKLLQVDRRADKDVISAVYRHLAMRHKDNQSLLKKLNEAKEVLTDEVERAKYDNPQKIGKVLRDYRILDKIAEGGFGTTYKAEHKDTGKLVCIKHASNISASDAELLLDEARTIWDLRHCGIPAIRHILRMPDDSLSIVMSYVPGPTIAQIMDSYPNGLDPEHVGWICERTLNILKYLHDHGVIHGDVKPQNIIVQNDDHTVVLVDYGLSVIKPSRTSEVKGYTQYFAAPEQIEGKTPLPETDLFGLGMTMIFALGGDVEKVSVPDDTPKPMMSFIKKMIRINPLSRPNWDTEDLCETIKTVRLQSFGRSASGMKPLKLKG